MILLTAGCATDGGRPPEAPAISPAPFSPAPFVSPAVPSFPAITVDPAAQACRALQKIVDAGAKVPIRRLQEVGDLGATSEDREVSMEARLLSDFAAVAALRIGAGGDPAQEAEQLRRSIRAMIEVCEAESYL